jgi:hypothetical protein
VLVNYTLDSDGVLRDPNGNAYNNGEPLELNQWYRVDMVIPLTPEQIARHKHERMQLRLRRLRLTLALIFITGMGVSLAGVYTTPGLIWVGVFIAIISGSALASLLIDEWQEES